MMQGDAYALPLEVQSDDIEITPDILFEFEATIGNLTKKLSNGGVSYEPETKVFMVHLTQQETFGLCGRERVQARLKFLSGDVRGVDFGEMFVNISNSKAVI